MPMRRSKYRADSKAAGTVPLKDSLPKTSVAAMIKSTDPWPMSPNIMPKKNGNVAIVSTAGLASRYLGIP